MRPVDDVRIKDEHPIDQYIKELNILVGSHADLVPAQGHAGHFFLGKPAAAAKGRPSGTDGTTDEGKKTKRETMGRNVNGGPNRPPRNSGQRGELFT